MSDRQIATREKRFVIGQTSELKFYQNVGDDSSNPGRMQGAFWRKLFLGSFGTRSASQSPGIKAEGGQMKLAAANGSAGSEFFGWIEFMSGNHSTVQTWVNAATFDELAEAQKLSLLLRGSGIESQIQDERRLQRLWFAVKPHGGVHVQVPTEASEKANKYLNTEHDARVLFQKAVHCPSCKSSRVQYPAMTRKNLLPTVVAQLLVLLGVQRHEFYCETCHYTWVPQSRNNFRLSAKRTARTAGSKETSFP